MGRPEQAAFLLREHSDCSSVRAYDETQVSPHRSPDCQESCFNAAGFFCDLLYFDLRSCEGALRLYQVSVAQILGLERLRFVKGSTRSSQPTGEGVKTGKVSTAIVIVFIRF